MPEHPAIKKRLTTPLYVCNLPFQSSCSALRDVRVLLTVARYSAWQYGYCRLDVVGGSPEPAEKPDVVPVMLIEHAGGRYHVAVGSVGAAVLFP
ncbi:hypothetical protein ACLB1R_32510 [Escherichia coli]